MSSDSSPNMPIGMTASMMTSMAINMASINHCTINPDQVPIQEIICCDWVRAQIDRLSRFVPGRDITLLRQAVLVAHGDFDKSVLWIKEVEKKAEEEKKLLARVKDLEEENARLKKELAEEKAGGAAKES